MKNTKKILGLVLALIVLTLAMSLSIFADKPETDLARGYYAAIYNEDGTLAWDVDASKSASEFNVHSALEDLYVFANNAFLIGLKGTPSFELVVYEDVALTRDLDVTGRDITIDVNGHSFGTNGFEITGDDSLTFKCSKGTGSVEGYTLNAENVFVEKSFVAQIGEDKYETFAEALAAAKAMTGDVVVEIYEKVTLNAGFNGSFTSITFVGKDTDAEIYLDLQGYAEIPGKIVAFEDLTLSKVAGGYVSNAGFMNLAFGIYGATEVSYDNCVFANGAYAATGKATFTNCEFYSSHDRYSFWAYGDDSVITIDNCDFVGLRGIKMYSENHVNPTIDLTVKNTDFTVADGKPAIVLTYGTKVTLEDNVYPSKGVFELDLDGKPNGVTVTSDVYPSCINDNGACGVLVDGKIYTTVAQAAEVAVEGSKVTLLYNSAETVELVAGVELDKNGFEAAGITVARAGLKGNGTESDPFLIESLEDLILFRDTVNTYTSDGSNQFKGQYVKLKTDIDLDGINWTPIGTNSVGDHMAFLGTFDGDGHTISNLYINADGDHLGFFARVGSYADDCTPTVKNIKFNNVDVSSNTTNGHGGSYVAGVIANAGGNSVVTNVHVTGDVYVVGYGYVGGIVGHGYPDIDNCSVKAEDGSYIHCHYWCVGGIIGYAGEGGTPITNSSVSGVDIWTAYGAGAAIAGLLQDGNKIENVTAENVEITSNSDYCMGYIAGNGECSTITNVTVNNVTATAKGEQITSTDAVATVNGKVYFSLQAAIDAVKGSTGNTITLLADASISGQNALDALTGDTLDLNDKTLTVSGNSYFSNGTTTFTNGNIVVSGYASDSFFCGYTAGAVIVFDDVVITGDNYKTGCALFNANQGKVEIKNSEITLSGDTTGGVIYGGSAVIDNTTIDATNVCRGITNSVATVQNNSVFAFDGGETCLNNSTVTINNSTVTIENATKRAVRLGDNTLALVNGATLTATNCVADIVKLNDSSNAVVTVDTTSTLNAVDNVTVYVAKIGDKYYTTFEDAVNAIPTDGTDVVIKILTDIELTNSIEFNYGTGKITFTADAPVVIKQTKVGLDLAFTIGKATTIVVDENVTFEIYDNASGMYVYYGPSLVINGSISGGQNWGCLYLYNGTHLVSTTGSINVGRLQIAHTELTVLGAIDTNYLLVEGADFIANGAIIEVGAIHDSNNGGTRWGASDFSFLNGTVVNANTITLKYADSVINLDLSSSITANKIEGIGKIVIDVSGFNGTATQVINADMSGFTGTVELVNGNGKQLYKITDSGLTIISAVAVIGENYFATLAEALKAANDGDTITLIWAEGDAPIAMNGSVYGKSVTITGTALVDWSKGNLFIGRGGEGNGTVIFDNANLTSASNNASYGIHVSGREKNTNNKYDGTLIIKNSTIVLDYLINKGNMTLDNSTLTVKNGFAIGGRPASETESGADATATITLNNGSKVVVNNHNGMGLGYEAIGVMNVNANSTFECTQNFLVTAKGTMNVNGGTIKVAGTFTNNGTIDVVSGTFSMDPSAFIKEGYSSIKNFDNMYVVGVAPTATVKDYGPTLLPAGGYGVWDGKNYTDKGTVDLPLSFVMQFIANQTAEDVKNSPYADWYGDFVITFTGIEDGSFTADGCYLAGFYGDFGWVKIPVDGMKIEEGVRYPVMLGVGLGQKYDYICSGVKDFKCALYITEDILAANPNLKVNLELAAIDNSKGQDAAAEALADKNSEYTFGITNYEYEAEDFVVKYVAQVGDKKYTSLQEAINAANGETVVILENIDLADTTVTVPAGTTVTLDLNGKVISGVCNANQASMFVIENTATLTVKDSATNGKITYAAGKSNVGFEMDVKGNLILESGTIEMTGSWSLGFAVDVRPNAWGTAYTAPTSFTMNGGKIVSSDTAVRVDSNSSNAYEPLGVYFTMNDGVIESGWDAIFVQHRYANKLYVNVKNGYVTGSNSALRIYGDVVSDVYFNVEGGTFVGELKNLEATGNGSTAITGGVFAKEPEVIPDGYSAIKNLDGMYVVGVAPTATVKDYGPTIIPAGEYGIWDGKNYTSKGTVDLPLSFVMQFLADQTASDVANSPYADWYADFVITFDGLESDAFIADGCYLAGYYGDFGWVKIPVDGMKIEEGVRYPVMLGVGLGQKYDYICSGVKDFKCALYITEEILEANPGLKVNLELAVVDNSKGESAAADALIENELVYNVVDYDYEAEDFKTYVAQIGDKKFTSLQAAIDYAIANGGVIELIGDVRVANTMEIPAGADITIDLAGKNITVANDTINLTINGKLTINDTIGGGVSTFRNHFVYGELVLNNGTIQNVATATGGFPINLCGGKVTINGGAVKAVNQGNYAIGAGSSTSSVVINNGLIEGNWGCVNVNAGTTVEINGGTFNVTGAVGGHCVYVGEGSAVINGGTFTPYNEKVASYAVYVNGANATATINGGKFYAGLANRMIGTADGGVLTLYGGTFVVDPSNFVATDYVAIKNLDGNYVVGVAPTATVKDYGPTLIPAGEYGVWDGKNYTSKGTVDLPLSFVMQFLANQTASDVANSPYADWYADFVITFDGLESDAFIADGCYLAGYYGDFGWVKIPVDGMKIEEGVRYPVMLGVGLGQKYDYICSGVKDFKCALYITEEILEANPGLKVNLELAVVDNSKGESAAADALVNNESVYNVVDYDYEAEDFIVNYVASVGEKNFTSLADAFKYANANGGTITLLEDITIDTETFTINSDAEITLDMNGKKISVVDKKEGSDTRANYELFYILGELTVTGNGTIELTSTYDRDWNAMSAIFHNRGGVLTIENGTYTNNGGTDMAYVIDNSGNSYGDVVTTINGGTFTTTYIAVRNRMDTYGKYGHGSVTLNINGGELTGKYAVWGQVSSTGVKGTVNVTGGKLTSAQGKTTILMDTDATGEMAVAVSGGTFSAAVDESYCAQGYIPVANNDGTFGVKEGAFVVRNTTTGVGYESLEAAITAAQAGDVIELLADVEATTVILIDKSLTINGNNHKVTSSANRVFRVTTSNTQVTLNDVNMVSTAVRVGTNDIRGISIDILDNVKLTLNNCSVDFTDASACDWAYAVNLTGGSNNTVTVNGGTYEGANVINVRGASQTVVVKDATLTSLYPNNDVYYGACIYVVQNENSSVTATDNTFNGSNAVAFNVGYTPITESNNIDNTKRVVAKIGNTYYTSLQDAIAAGGEVKLLANITLTETITVTGTVTLDLNGKVITGTDNNTSGNFYLINVNKGNLTINDTVGTGAITLEATVERNWSSSSVVVANNQGTVTVNGGTIEHLGGTSMAYAIDNLTNGTIGDANLVINGGKVESTYFAVRQFANSATNENNVTVTGGNVGYMWIQSPNSYVNNADLTVTAGTVSGICLSGVNAEITLDAKADCVGEVYGNAPAGECVIVVDGKYTLTKAVAKIGDTYYATLQEAFNAGGNVVLLDNVNITSTIKLVAGKTVTLDLNGYTIDGIGNVRIAIMSYGDLTIKDSSAEKTGAIKAGIGTGGNAINICAGTFTFESGNIYSLNNAILIDEQAATVNILGGKITAEPSTKNSAVFYISSTSNTVVNISGGEMVGYNGMLIWNNNEINISGGTITATGSTAIQGNGTCDNTKITIENGKLSGKWAAIYHPQNGELNISGGELTGYTGVVIKSGKVTISGGTFNGTGAKQAYQPVSSGYVDTGDALYVEVYDNSTNSENYGKPTVVVTGGTFISANGKAVASYANTNNNVEKLTGFISGGIFSTDVSDLCAEGFVCVENENGMFGIIEGLKGSGTEEDPFQIGSLEDLIFFRDSVNAGETRYNAAGVYVALTANIDMSSVDWSVNIGDDCNATFDGIFDGKNFTISNLNSTETAQKSDGYICTGLFGAIYGSATIKNLTITNVTINTGAFTGNNAGAVVGFAYNCTGSIENVTVNGDIKIDANGVYGVGAIVGYDYGSTDLKITNCKVSGNEGSYINAVSGVGGIIGYSNGAKISGCTVENVSISGLGLVGGIVGIANPNTVVDTVTVKNVTLTATKAEWVNGVAIVIGTISGNGVTVANVTYENVNADRLVGSVYAEQPTTVVSKVPAKVGNKYYVTLQDAIANANGGTVELLAPIVIEKGETVEIDLKGQTVVYNSTTINESMFTNYGTLVINDTVGTGVINYNYTGAADPSFGMGNYTINNAGTLTVNGGKITIANLRSHAKYPINNNSINSDAIVEINGGHLYNYNTSAIRMICGTYKNSVTINGGLVEGYCAIWVQNPGKNTVNCELTINGGEIKSTAAAYVNGTAELKDVASRIYFTTEGGAWSESSFVALNGGTFNENVDLVNTAPNDYTIGKATFNGFVKLPVAEVNGVKYATLQEAIDNANGGVVTLLAPIVIEKGETVEIDLKGETVVYSVAKAEKSVAMITNKGTLTIKDSVSGGKLSFTYTGESYGYGKGMYTISNEGGTLNITGGTIENLTNVSGSMYDAIDNNSTLGNTVLNISGGTISCPAYIAIRYFANSTTYENIVNVTGGTINGGNCSIWVQNPGSNQPLAALNVENGTFIGRILLGTSSGFTTAIKGGTFSTDVNAQCADGYICVANGDGTYTVREGKFVAEANGVKYETLAEAIAVGGEVKLLADITSGRIYIANKVVTLDLNGYVLSGVCNESQSTLIYIENNATLTVKDSSEDKTGKITYAQGTSNVGWTIDVKGAFVLESGTIELTGSWSIGYAVDVRPNSWGTAYTNATTFVMNGGKIISSDGAVRVASSSSDKHTDVSASFTMNGGLIDAAWDGVFVQQSNTIYDKLNVTVNGGTIESDLNPIRVYGPAPTGYVDGTNCINITLAGGTLTYTGTETRDWVIENILRVGGGNSVETIVANGSVVVSSAIAQSVAAPDGYKWSANDNGTYTLAECNYVAEANGVKYETLQEAIANANGSTVTLLADITSNEGFVINGDVEIDLNGKTISIVDDNTEVNCVFHIENGTVVIKNGTISTNNGQAIYAGLKDNAEYAPVVTLENVTLEGADFGLSVFGGANVTIGNGVAISGSVEALRVWNSAKVTVNADATITCTGNGKDARAIAVYEAASVSVVGGTFTGAVDAIAYNGKTPTLVITGGTFTVDVNQYCANGYICVADGEAYIVREGKFVAEVNGVKYETLQAAIDAANGGTVTLLETFVVNAGETVALDLKGCTIVGNASGDKAYEAIRNNGTLTITNGTVVCNSTSSSTAFAINTITNCGSLTITNATIKNVGAGNQIGYAIDNNSTSYNATLVVGEGAVITAEGSAYFDGIRLFCNSLTAENNVTVNGGSVSSIWMQNPSDGATDKNTKPVKGSVTITNGTVNGLYIEPSSNFELAISGGNIGTVATFGTANTVETEIAKGITGGTFTVDVNEYCADGYICVADGNGTYTIKKLFKVLGTSIYLDTDLSIDFIYDGAEFNGTDYYAVIKKCHAENCACEATTYYLSWNDFTVDTYGYVHVKANGIAAKEMVCDIEVVIYKGTYEIAEDGTVTENGYAVSQKAVDSIVKYAERGYNYYKVGGAGESQMNDATRKAYFTTLADMLVYGAEAQQFFDHYVGIEGGLATTVSETIKEIVAEYATPSTVTPDLTYDIIREEADGTTYFAGANIDLENTIFFNLYFINIDFEKEFDAKIVFTHHSGDKHEYSISAGTLNYSNNMGYLQINIDDLAPADLRLDVECIVTVEGEQVSRVVISVEDYLAVIRSSDADRASMYNAVINYADSAEKYFYGN